MADDKPEDRCNLDDIYERLEAVEKKIEEIKNVVENITEKLDSLPTTFEIPKFQKFF
jgi:hypothetical protein